MNGTKMWARNAKILAELDSKKRLESASDSPDALAGVLVDLVTTLGPEYVDALKAKLGGASGGSGPQASAHRHATRSPMGAPLLTGRDREEFDRAMGLDSPAPKRQGIQADGSFVMHTMTPTEARRRAARGMH